MPLETGALTKTTTMNKFISFLKECISAFESNDRCNELYLEIDLDELSKYFDGIYTTNSYKDIDCGFDTLKNPNQDFIEQLNVF